MLSEQPNARGTGSQKQRLRWCQKHGKFIIGSGLVLLLVGVGLVIFICHTGEQCDYALLYQAKTNLSHKSIAFIQYIPETETVLTADTNGDCEVNSASDGTIIKRFSLPSQPIEMKTSPNGRYVAVSTSKVVLLDSKGWHAKELDAFASLFDFVSIGALAVLGDKGAITIWNTSNCEVMRKHDTNFKDDATAFSTGTPDCGLVAIGGKSGDILVFDTVRDEPVFQWKGEGDKVDSVLLANADTLLFVAYRSRIVAVFDIKTSRNLGSMPLRDICHAYSLDQSREYVIIAGRNPSVRALHIATLRECWGARFNNRTFANCVSIGGKTIYVGCATGEVWKLGIN